MQRLRLRQVRTYTSKFGTNIVGMKVQTSDGVWHKLDEMQYPTDSQVVIELDLRLPDSSGQLLSLVGGRAQFAEFSLHKVPSTVQFALAANKVAL